MTDKTKGVLTLPEVKVEAATAVKDVRFYLNAPYLDLKDKGKPKLVATNGHFLLVADVTIEGTVAEGWLSLEAINRVRKDCGKYSEALMQFDGDMHGTGDVMFKRPDMKDAKYPDWRNVAKQVEDHPDKPDICFKHAYLKTIADSLCTNKEEGIALTLGRSAKSRAKNKPIDSARPIVVRAGRKHNVGYTAILMPMRFD